MRLGCVVAVPAMRRLARVATLAGAVVVLLGIASPAAHADDLDDYLDRAARADYAGRRVVVTVWNGHSEAAVTDVEHAAGMVMISGEGDGDSVMIGDGKMQRTGVAGVTFSSWSVEDSTAKYSTSDAVDVTRLGRKARSITIFEGDVKRATIVFDAVTWAPLATEIYDDTGRLFRLSTFTEIGPVSERAYATLRAQAEDAYEVVPRQSESDLPARAGGYQRLDTYLDGDGVSHAFYGDGLFSFSVFEIPPDRAQPDFAGATAFEVGEATYLVLVEPAETWVSWRRGDVGFVLVGDLPPDHLVAVLGDLPAPQGRSLLDKILGFFR